MRVEKRFYIAISSLVVCTFIFYLLGLTHAQQNPIVGHPASEILPGRFQEGEYIFPGTIGIGKRRPRYMTEGSGEEDEYPIYIRGHGRIVEIGNEDTASGLRVTREDDKRIGGGIWYDSSGVGYITSYDRLSIHSEKGNIIFSGGSVGIGDFGMSPKTKLDVQGDIRASRFCINNNGNTECMKKLYACACCKNNFADCILSIYVLPPPSTGYCPSEWDEEGGCGYILYH